MNAGQGFRQAVHVVHADVVGVGPRHFTVYREVARYHRDTAREALEEREAKAFVGARQNERPRAGYDTAEQRIGQVVEDAPMRCRLRLLTPTGRPGQHEGRRIRVGGHEPIMRRDERLYVLPWLTSTYEDHKIAGELQPLTLGRGQRAAGEPLLVHAKWSYAYLGGVQPELGHHVMCRCVRWADDDISLPD